MLDRTALPNNPGGVNPRLAWILRFAGEWLFVCLLLPASILYGAPGRIDIAFPHFLNADAVVNAIEIQPDGKILIAGPFSTFGVKRRSGIARLNADGSLDETFDTGGIGVGEITKIKLQPDGKILIGGSFHKIGDTFHGPIARLNTDGSVDTSFAVSGIDVTFVFDIDLQQDGKILISASNLIGASFVARLLQNGANDGGIGQQFFSASGFGYSVADVPGAGKILIGGNFALGNAKGLVRVSSAGGVDITFNASVTSTAFGTVVHPRPLPSGKLYIYGNFDSVNGATRVAIARLENDGTIDTFFNPATSGIAAINDIAIQPDGKIIIAGRGFPTNVFPRGNIARLNPDGSLDQTFYVGRGANNDIKAVRLQGTTKLLVGGAFTRFQNLPRSGLVRLNL